jgi:hypothetical protein
MPKSLRPLFKPDLGSPKSYTEATPAVFGPLPAGFVIFTIDINAAYVRISNDGSTATTSDLRLSAYSAGGLYTFAVRNGDSLSFLRAAAGTSTANVTVAEAVG